jgi:PhnB protein
MEMSPYLFFNGQCEAAFKFYEKALGGKIEAMVTHEGTPAEGQVPADWKKKIIHASMKIGDMLLMASDAPPDRSSGGMNGFSVNLTVVKPADADRIFNALAQKGTVRMPIGETFWAERFGMLTDQFGTPWMVNCYKQRS